MVSLLCIYCDPPEEWRMGFSAPAKRGKRPRANGQRNNGRRFLELIILRPGDSAPLAAFVPTFLVECLNDYWVA